jgi:HAD superfamily hydrolase (TIGR01509 family)
MTIQAVFWDYDNTILTTEEAHWKKHETVLAKHGIALSEKFRKRIYENNGSQNWEWMNRELSLKVPEKTYLEEIDAEFLQHILDFEIRPGVTEIFQIFHNLGIPQAIVTNARRSSAQPVMDEKNITPIMRFILFKEDYEGRKPEPAPYLRGFEKMESILQVKIEPHRCLAIEDDPNGVESAHKAGAIVIHRKLREEDAASPLADYSCFHTEDFIRIVEDLLSQNTDNKDIR